MKKIVVLTGAGMSAESGIATFRDSGGLWEQYRIEDVATPQAWHKNRKLVLDFYNQRRQQVLAASPNPGHLALASLQEKYEVQIITQNIDDLHERAGSRQVLHLHGEIRKARSTADPNLIYEINGWEIREGELCERGFQLRPHIVWFGEEVPELPHAAERMLDADIFLVIGTSLAVYPAAGLVHYAPSEAKKFLIDPNAPERMPGFQMIRQNAGTGVPALVHILLEQAAAEKLI